MTAGGRMCHKEAALFSDLDSITQQSNQHPCHFIGIHSPLTQKKKVTAAIRIPLSLQGLFGSHTLTVYVFTFLGNFFFLPSFWKWRKLRVQWQYLKKAKNLNDRFLRSMLSQTCRVFCGITLLLLFYMWLQKRGCFLRAFTSGLGFGGRSGLAALPAGWKARKDWKKRVGRARPFLALLLFHFIGSPYTQNTHAWRAQPGRQSQEMTSSTGREAKHLFFFLLPLLLSEAGASRSISSWRDRGNPEELEQHHNN